MSDELSQSATRLRNWIVEAALPFWRRAQEPSGAWVEALHLDGTPNPQAVRRHRVQARQAYTYALATERGWIDGANIVRRTLDFQWEAGWQGDGLIHSLNPDGSVESDQIDLYDHAFYLLALGWGQHVVGGQEARIAKVTQVIDGLSHASGGFAEGRPATLPRRQNPHMHLFETCLNLHQLGIPGDWWTRARDLLSLFEAHFHDPRHKSIVEFFSDDWTALEGPVEPGHGCEWVWLLGLWERLGGAPRPSARNGLYQQALVTGGVWLWDAMEFEDGDWEPARETSRLWVQTELIKAHLTQAEHGVAGARAMAAAGIDGLLADWLHPRGTWTDKIGACGQVLSDTIPTSTFYHLITLASEADRVAGR